MKKFSDGQSSSSAREAAHLSVTQAWLNIVGASITFWMWKGFKSFPLWVCQNLTLVLAVATLAAVRWAGGRWKSGTAAIVFAVNLLPVLGMLWWAYAELAVSNEFWAPFQVHKLSVLTIALLAPGEAWVGGLGIAAFTVMAVVQYSLFSEQTRALMHMGEPWGSVAFGAFAVILYLYRLRAHANTQEKAHAQAEAKMMRQMVRVLLAVRDLANSPIQVLAVDAEILAYQHPETFAIVERVRRSVARLARINEIVSLELGGLSLRPDECSFDAQAILKSLGREGSTAD